MTTSLMHNTKLIAVVGETASGKTRLSIEIAKRWDGEIISADSRAIYEGMDVGTAKPDSIERAGISHYGFDLVKPDEKYTAAQFKEYADERIKDITGRGKIPILVGGTGLYIDGVLFNYSFGGSVNEEFRSQLNNKDVDELATIAQEKNIEVSEQTKSNKRHLIRLIERDGVTEQDTDPAYDALLLGYIVNKNKLRDRVKARTESMFKLGLRKEYNDLRQKYDLDSEAFTGIGYQEFRDWELGNASMSEVKRQIVKNTMNLAKRQRTWFKRNRSINWIETQDEALDLVERFMGR